MVVIWPHIWLMLPDTARTEITATRQALNRAAILIAWALLYLPLAWWWWPAAVIAVMLVLVGRRRIRTAADTYAVLLEAACRLHVRELAERLGVETAAPLSHVTGDAVTRALTHSAPPVDSSTVD
ncbi:hypothetical protein LUX01_00440 [Streptomyces sudanensis]|uniref:hypothetical protein n=1 Tax=Streptomyces sudanensis TaxID=436397 RepID=UPI0020CE14CF|nr:hypothetical protein [Streptomyces sudanensis]MCP9985387.1 hypothetical protein [Streptomyces sudanensis]